MARMQFECKNEFTISKFNINNAKHTKPTKASPNYKFDFITVAFAMRAIFPHEIRTTKNRTENVSFKYIGNQSPGGHANSKN